MSVVGVTCPTWCLGEHEKAVAEGIAPEDIDHGSVDLTMRVDTIVNRSTGQVLREGRGTLTALLKQPMTPAPFGGYPLVELEVNSERVDLTTGEARRLAAMLLHLADQEDLHHWQ